MATIQDIKDLAIAISDGISTLDSDLDLVKERLDALSAGVPVTQEQLDEIYNALSLAQSHTQSVVAEAKSLVATEPTEPSEEV